MDGQKARLSSSNKYKNIEILTNMRHEGSNLLLIDFSLDIHPALFFACDGELETEGKLMILERSEIPHIDDINYGADDCEKLPMSTITPVPNKAVEGKVKNQKSIFVYALNGYIDKELCLSYTIKSKDKKRILRYLKKYCDISSGTIYKDSLGRTDSDESRAVAKDRFGDALFCYGSEDFDKAIQAYSEAIDRAPYFAEAYVGRGFSRNETLDFDGAIKDCTKAIKLKPHFAEAYASRGNAKGLRGMAKNLYGISMGEKELTKIMRRDLEGAIKDWKKAIELESKLEELLRPSIIGAEEYIEKADEEKKKAKPNNEPSQ